MYKNLKGDEQSTLSSKSTKKLQQIKKSTRYAKHYIIKKKTVSKIFKSNKNQKSTKHFKKSIQDHKKYIIFKKQLKNLNKYQKLKRYQIKINFKKHKKYQK